jgi:predicted nuclease of predicted toxin-antitoxin system
MRVLLDECLPRPLAALLVGHAAQTVPDSGWAGKKNGELLRLAASRFDVFVTIDQNLEYQQHLRDAPLAVVVLVSRSNRFPDLEPLVPKLLEVLRTVPRPGAVVRVGV